MKKIGPRYRRKKGRKDTDIWALALRQNGCCKYCKRHMVIGAGCGISATKDHVKPKSKGGRGGTNIVAACFDCNQAKADMELPEFWMARNRQALP